MKMKRTVALLAALAALSCLAGCAVNGQYDALSVPEDAVEEKAPAKAAEPDVFAEPTPEPTAEPTPEPTAEPTPEPTAEPTPEPTAEPTPEPTAEPTPEPTPKPSPRPAAWGSVKGDEYTNRYFGLTCALAKGWTFLTDEQLDQHVEGAVEDPALEGFEDDMQLFLASDGNGCAAAAVSDDSLLSFNVVVEALGSWGKYITDEDMCAIALHQLGVEDGGDLTDLGLPGGVIERNTVSFAGEDRPGLLLRFTDSSLGIDVPMYMQFVYILGDEYAMQITMSSSFDQDGLADIADMFSLEETK